MRRFVVCVAVLALTACQDRGPTGPNGALLPQFAFDDSREGFQFLSPTPPGNPSEDGDFNPDLAPFVRICRLDISPPATPTGATSCFPAGDVNNNYYDVCFTIDAAAPCGGPIAVDEVNEQYAVSWTGLNELKASHPSNPYYRITVSLDTEGEEVLGFADVQLTDGSGGGLNVSGNTLPIKFWIAYSATCDVDACIAFSVSTASGGSGILEEEEETLPTGTAGFQFNKGFCASDPNAADGECPDFVTVIAARYRGPERCIPNPELTDGWSNVATLQYDVCVQVRTIPAGVQFKLDQVLVGLCVDTRAEGALLDRLRFLKVHERDPTNTAAGETPVDLVGAPLLGNDFFNGSFQCPEEEDQVPAIAATSNGFFGQLAARTGRILSRVGVRLLRPAPLYARRRDVPFGASPSDFGSRLGVVLPVVARYEGDFGTGFPGAAANPSPRIRVLAVGPDGSGDSDELGVPFVQVKFDDGDGDDTIDPANGVDATGPDGYADISWTLGTLATNPQKLLAKVGAPRRYVLSEEAFPNNEDETICAPGFPGCYWWFSHEFTAFARLYDVIFLSPLGQSGSGLTNVREPVGTLTLEVCGPFGDTDAERALAQQPRTRCPASGEIIDPPIRKNNYWETSWKTNRNTVNNSLYRIEVLVGGGVTDWFLVRRGGGGGSDPEGTYQFQTGSQLPLKFVLVNIAP